MAEERKSWMLRDALGFIGTWVALGLIQGMFGIVAAMWVGSVVMAYCIGVLWGAGDQIRKHEADAPTIRENGRG